MPGKLTYFGVGGRAEAIRALLWHANFEYEDVRVNMEQWQGDMKQDTEHFPLGSIPVWEEDGFSMP